MNSLLELFSLGATLGSAMVAGLCFAFAAFIMAALDDLGAPQAIRAMQSINAVILRSGAMVVWMGTAVLATLTAALSQERALPIAAAALYGIGAFLITGRGNVPLNERLDRVDPDSPAADEAWRAYRAEWGRWNALRTVFLALASVGFVLAR